MLSTLLLIMGNEVYFTLYKTNNIEKKKNAG